MNTASIPMPGALRWRFMHPLIDGDGSCTLIYDLERAAVLEVPQELQFHVAPALETGDLDDDLLSWLVNEDLLTTEGWMGWAGQPAGFEAPKWWSLWAIHRFDDEVHARIAPVAESEVAGDLASVFKQSAGVSRVQLLLDWEGMFPGVSLVERVVVEAGRLAAMAHQEVSFELVLDIRQVTRPVAAFLAASPLHLRLRCGEFPARDAQPAEYRGWESSAASVFFLLDLFGLLGKADRVNVQCNLAGGARLLDLWSWAQRTGVRHLDAVRGEPSAPGDTLPPASRVREYRNDLLAVCDEMACELGARRVPIDYRPLTRMVRRLMGSEPFAAAAAGGEPVWETDSPDGFPGFDLWAGAEEVEPAAPAGSFGGQDDPDASPCRACWGRSLCNHSSLLAAPVGDDLREPSPERCPVWLAEAEVALRLYHRLAQCDPLDVLRLLGDSARMPLDPLGRREDLGTPKQLF
jgi:hypothetical protein